MRQLRLFGKENNEFTSDIEYSNESLCPDEARKDLEATYRSLLQETQRFNRSIVSFQANKTELLHSWVKYREGFSSSLVEMLLKEFEVEPGEMILDPFAGSCTTLLVAKMYGINALGIELLPNSHLAWQAKSNVFNYDLDELQGIYSLLEKTTPPKSSNKFPHIAITESAFPEDTEQELMNYRDWTEGMECSSSAKTLLRFMLMSILEDVSYTRKDGQYLRWDSRADKIQRQNQKRIQSGRKPYKNISKGELPQVKETLLKVFRKILSDIGELQKTIPMPSYQELKQGSTLYELPRVPPNQFSAVITSPPYANRYDYTRTYALELAFLDVQDRIFSLRQDLLSCTVENKSKHDQLEKYYTELGASKRYCEILKIIKENSALQEVNRALEIRLREGHMNNSGVLPMIDQYFTELTFVFAELERVCKDGAHIAFVNDNVRYGGEVIPVDLLTTQLAQQVGLCPVAVYVLPQRKGNSSQQMSKFGRQPLRKSITIWRK